MEDCLLEFCKAIINRFPNKKLLSEATTLRKKIALYQLSPRIVKVMYFQLFIELRKKGVTFHHEDFGIGVNKEFRFDKLYREDHPDLF